MFQKVTQANAATWKSIPCPKANFKEALFSVLSDIPYAINVIAAVDVQERSYGDPDAVVVNYTVSYTEMRIHGATMYSYLSTKLSHDVGNGSFDVILSSITAKNGCSSLYSSKSTMVSISSAKIFYTPTYSPTASPLSYLESIENTAAIVSPIVVVIFLAVVSYYIYQERKKKHLAKLADEWFKQQNLKKAELNRLKNNGSNEDKDDGNNDSTNDGKVDDIIETGIDMHSVYGGKPSLDSEQAIATSPMHNANGQKSVNMNGKGTAASVAIGGDTNPNRVVNIFNSLIGRKNNNDTPKPTINNSTSSQGREFELTENPLHSMKNTINLSTPPKKQQRQPVVITNTSGVNTPRRTSLQQMVQQQNNMSVELPKESSGNGAITLPTSTTPIPNSRAPPRVAYRANAIVKRNSVQLQAGNGREGLLVNSPVSRRASYSGPVVDGNDPWRKANEKVMRMASDSLGDSSL